MAQSATGPQVRRVVTGHDAEGRSIIAADTTTIQRGTNHAWVNSPEPALMAFVLVDGADANAAAASRSFP